MTIASPTRFEAPETSPSASVIGSPASIQHEARKKKALENYYKNHEWRKEQSRAYQSLRYELKRDEILARRNSPEWKARQRTWKKNNPDAVKASLEKSNKKNLTEVTASYVSKLLKLPVNKIPQSVVAVKGQLIKIKRLIKEQKLCQNQET